MVYFPSLSRQNWPHDPQELDGFYGNPRGAGGGANPSWEAGNLVPFTYPWHEKGAQTYRIHVKAKPSLMRVLNAIWDYLGHDQTKITYYHLDETGGTYVYRQNRNAPTELSNHARGIAIDLAPDENPNRAAWVDQAPPHLPRFVIEAFKQEGWRWGGDYSTTKDAMHFEAVHDEHHDQPPVPAPQSVASQPTSMVPAGSGSVTVPTSWGLPSDLGGSLAIIVRGLAFREVSQSPEIIGAKQAAQAFLVALDKIDQAAATPATPAPVQRIPDSPTRPVPAFIKLSPTRAKVMGPDLSSNDPGKMTWWLASPIPPPTGATTMSNQDQDSLPAGVTVGGSPFGSKVNITAASMAISAIVIYFTSGKLNLSADQVAAMLTLLGTVLPVAIMLFRTFATTTVFTHSLPKQ